MLRPFCLVLLTLAAPLRAQEAAGPNRDPAGVVKRGAVAEAVLARDLYTLGMDRDDAQLVLAAARLMAGLTLAKAERVPVSEPEQAGAPVSGPAPPFDAAQMLADARVLAGEDELLGGLIDEAGAEAARAGAVVVEASRGVLAPGATDRWSVPFFAGVTAEVALLGDGTAGLDLQVTDETGAVVCGSASASDRLYCAFVPAWNGYFSVTVANPGDATRGYDLLTN